MSRKEEIRQKALEIMKIHGFNGLTMRLLAKEIGIEAPSIYNHIASKDELLESVCFDLASRFESAVMEVKDIYFNASEKLFMLVKFHVEILCNDLNASSVFMHDWRYLKDSSRKVFIQKRNNYELQIREIIHLGIKEGYFNEVETKFATITLLSSLNSVVEWYKPSGSLTPEQVAIQLNQFVQTGLRKQ
jgi:AcrR family transcriptional regulator